MNPDRTLPWDWYPARIPLGVTLDETAYVESSYSFLCYRSRLEPGVAIGRGSSAFLGTMFDVGPDGRVTLGDFVLVNGARIVCDAAISIGDYSLVSWNVVIMDTYRVPIDPARRRATLRAVPDRDPRRLTGDEPGRPVTIGRAAWIGFDACILPGVTIGEGAIVGARSVVMSDVDPFTIVAGNPARVVRRLTDEERSHEG
jgi:acetyltransferase-like isoleucine patch superfamily enzyme